MAGTGVLTPHPVLDKPLIRFGKRILERTAPGTAPDEYRILGIHPLTPHIGAEIAGVDLSQPIGGDLADELRQALLEWKVIFFRDQRDFGPEDHAALAGLWGEPEANPFFPTGDRVSVSRLAKDAMAVGTENIWHSDHSFMAAPALGSVLRAVEIPASGGDTLWADMGAAYDNLPDATKERIEGLTAVHDWVPTWGATMAQDQIAALRQTLPHGRAPRGGPASGDRAPSCCTSTNRSPRASSDWTRKRAASCSTSSCCMPGSPSTRCASAGSRTPSRSGTTSRSSTTRSTTTTRNAASWNASQSPGSRSPEHRPDPDPNPGPGRSPPPHPAPFRPSPAEPL